MTKPRHCAENERIKRRYLTWLKEAKGYSTPSIDMAAAAISRFESHTGYRDFKRIHLEQVRAFKNHLSGKALGKRSGALLSKATVTFTLRRLQAFFKWLADQPGYRSRIKHSDADYFTPLGQDERVANGIRSKPVPELHEIEAALRAMPTTTEIERRDQAVVAFIIVSGGRDRAVASLKLKHVDAASGVVLWDAREVRTKRAKTFTTKYFPVGDLPREIIENWIAFLKTEKGFGPDDPLFPATHVELQGQGNSPNIALSRRNWQTTSPIRNIFKAAFARAGLPYFNPHSFRSTLARRGQKLCKTHEELKAWSQNLGHSKMMTTLSSYGTIDEARQFQIIENLGEQKPSTDIVADFAEFVRNRTGGLNWMH